ncbi:hypothetical protein [Paenibacillus glacialis]|uniref:Uncharacterized protein n=1 Tax=Paenibacillus glacialis TaxID=494026 RepID=A0A168N6F2_9BACL|nr:hypothetical protein [Paenibacillus glacialis]OAB45446.1 hypothetical protein PGLA_04115 [Paenibacillus glacialis]
MRKIISTLLVLLILFNSIPNYGYSLNVNADGSGGISTRSTNVWAEEYKVEFGKDVKIHFSFDDEPHPVRIEIYKDEQWLKKSTVWSTDMSNT